MGQKRGNLRKMENGYEKSNLCAGVGCFLFGGLFDCVLDFANEVAGSDV